MEGEQSEIVGGGGKLIRSGANEQQWNGVGIVLSKNMKREMISVSRKSDPVMSIDLRLEEMVMCAYAPQVVCMENKKETF